MAYTLRVKNHYHQSEGVEQIDTNVKIDLKTNDRERAVTAANKYINEWIDGIHWKAWNMSTWNHAQHHNYSSNESIHIH